MLLGADSAGHPTNGAEMLLPGVNTLSMIKYRTTTTSKGKQAGKHSNLPKNKTKYSCLMNKHRAARSGLAPCAVGSLPASRRWGVARRALAPGTPSAISVLRRYRAWNPAPALNLSYSRQSDARTAVSRQGPPHLPETWRQVEGGGHRSGGGGGDEGRVRGRGGKGGARRGEGGCWGQGRGVGGRAEGHRGGGGAPWPEATARHPRQPPSRTGSCLLVGGAPRPEADGSACGPRGRRRRR